MSKQTFDRDVVLLVSDKSARTSTPRTIVREAVGAGTGLHRQASCNMGHHTKRTKQVSCWFATAENCRGRG